MTEQPGVYFAQFTDVHVGNNNLNGEAAKRYVRWALDEAESLTPRLKCILVTADLVFALLFIAYLRGSRPSA